MSNRLELAPHEPVGRAEKAASGLQGAARDARMEIRPGVVALSAPWASAQEQDALPYFVVSYELGSDWSAEDYKELYRVLRSFPSWTWLLDSVWMLQADSAESIHMEIDPLLAESDALLVLEVAPPAGDPAGVPHRLSALSLRGRALTHPLFG